MRSGIKNVVLLMLIVSMFVLINGCGDEDNTRRERESAGTSVTPDTRNVTVTGKAKPTEKAAPEADATETPEATATVTPNIKPTPGTAEKPAALNIQNVAHATGVTETYTDPETGKTYEVLEDSGEDGCTRTMNCFDEEGSLVWWESFRYDEYSRVSEIIRREPVDNKLIFRKVLYYHGDNIETMILYEAVPAAADGIDEQKTLAETYFPDGTICVRTLYYPYMEVKRYTPMEYFEYDENGTETYHASYTESGEVNIEYIYGEKFFRVPDKVTEMLVFLNDASDEDFEVAWKSCMKKIEEYPLTEEWDALCEVFSGYCDIHGTALVRLRDEYGLKLFSTRTSCLAFYREITSADKSVIRLIEESEINPLLYKKIYRKSCYPDMGGTLWLPGEYKEATKSLKREERKDGDPIRILVVDYSSTIWSDTISRDLLLEDTKYSERMIERAETILKGLFSSVSGKVCFTSYPELADIVFEIRTEYPYAGQYAYSNGTKAQVWNLSMNVKAINMRGNGEVSATFEHIAGNKVSTSGGTKIYMRVPDVTDDEYRDKAENFTNTVLSWFAE